MSLTSRKEAALAVSIVEVLEALGEDAGTGQTQQIRCPVHEDRHPSARLYAEENHIYCFTCQSHFDPIGLVQAKLGLTFVDAITWLEGVFDLTLHVAGLGTLVQASLRRTRPPDPAPLLQVLDHALRQTRPHVSMGQYANWTVALDLLAYHVAQGMLTPPVWHTHATTFLGRLHAVCAPVPGLPTPPVGTAGSDCRHDRPVAREERVDGLQHSQGGVPVAGGSTDPRPDGA